MLENGVAQATSVADMTKEAVNPSGWIQKIRDHKEALLEVCIYTGIGFFCGFLLKRYSTYVISFLVSIGILMLLQQVDLVTFSINWAKIQSFFGMQPLSATPDGSVITNLWDWAKLHVRPVVSVAFGFFIGFYLA